jgi:hypothetical protein
MFFGVPLHTTSTTLHFLKTTGHNTSPETENERICAIVHYWEAIPQKLHQF